MVLIPLLILLAFHFDYAQEAIPGISHTAADTFFSIRYLYRIPYTKSFELEEVDVSFSSMITDTWLQSLIQDLQPLKNLL